MELFRVEDQNSPLAMLGDVLKLYSTKYGLNYIDAAKVIRVDLRALANNPHPEVELKDVKL